MKRGFALPTVLLTSTVMLIVLFAGLAAAASIRASLDEQYFQQLAREAAESGVTMAKECYAKNKTTATLSQWPNANTLRPDTDCFGATVSSQSKLVLSGAEKAQTRFTVAPVVVENGVVYFDVRGIAERVRSSGQVVSSGSGVYEQAIKYRVSLTQTGIVSGKKTVCSIVAYRLYCWGRNDANQIPGQPNGTVTRPVEVQIGGAGSNYYVQAAAAGWSHACAITSSTPIIDNTQGNQTQIWCWGDNVNGQLGISNTSAVWTTPQQVSSSLGLDFANRNFVSMSTRDQVCVIGQQVNNAANKRLYCWGRNNRGQAGDLANNSVPDPKLNASQAQRTSGGSIANGVTQVSSIGPANTCFINASTPYCIGGNDSGASGMLGVDPATVGQSARGYTPGGNTSSNPLYTKTKFLAIDFNHACAINTSNDMYCWGNNAEATAPYDYDGRLDPGIPESAGKVIFTPTLMRHQTSPQKFTAVSTGARSTCAIATNKKVYCWGNNREGELGIGGVGVVAGVTDANGRVAARDMRQVRGPLESRDAREITSGGNMYCVITTEEETYCWGEGTYGQLGNGSTSAQTLPTQVEFIPSLLY